MKQASLGAFRANPAAIRADSADGMPGDEKSLTEWLQTSFWALPSDQHRHMFLDVATLMHGERLIHLSVTWRAHVQLDHALLASAAGQEQLRLTTQPGFWSAACSADGQLPHHHHLRIS